MSDNRKAIALWIVGSAMLAAGMLLLAGCPFLPVNPGDGPQTPLGRSTAAYNSVQDIGETMAMQVIRYHRMGLIDTPDYLTAQTYYREFKFAMDRWLAFNRQAKRDGWDDAVGAAVRIAAQDALTRYQLHLIQKAKKED